MLALVSAHAQITDSNLEGNCVKELFPLIFSRPTRQLFFYVLSADKLKRNWKHIKREWKVAKAFFFVFSLILLLLFCLFSNVVCCRLLWVIFAFNLHFHKLRFLFYHSVCSSLLCNSIQSENLLWIRASTREMDGVGICYLLLLWRLLKGEDECRRRNRMRKQQFECWAEAENLCRFRALAWFKNGNWIDQINNVKN